MKRLLPRLPLFPLFLLLCISLPPLAIAEPELDSDLDFFFADPPEKENGGEKKGEEDNPEAKPKEKPEKEAPTKKGDPPSVAIPPQHAAAPKVDPLPPKRAPQKPGNLRFHMKDGAVITGRLKLKHFTVTTEFGSLEVPVERIEKLVPGIDSDPALAQTIDGLIERIGGDDFHARERALKQLQSYGALVRKQLEAVLKDKNPERVKSAKQILTALDEQEMGEEETFDEPDGWEPGDPWLRADLIQTKPFTMTGAIEPQAFQIESKYGLLNVTLSDISYGFREKGEAGNTRRILTLDQQNFAMVKMKSSGIRVEKGDTIQLTADGSLTLTPWGGQAAVGPEGNTNYGQGPSGNPTGSLLMRIGDSGDLLKVGKKFKVKAKKAGVIKFGIAMQAGYAGHGYQFPGEYRIRLSVEPGS